MRNLVRGERVVRKRQMSRDLCDKAILNNRTRQLKRETRKLKQNFLNEQHTSEEN